MGSEVDSPTDSQIPKVMIRILSKNEILRGEKNRRKRRCEKLIYVYSFETIPVSGFAVSSAPKMQHKKS